MSVVTASPLPRAVLLFVVGGGQLVMPDRLLARGNDVAQVLGGNPGTAGRLAPEDSVALVKPEGVLARVNRATWLARARARVVNPVLNIKVAILNPPGPGPGGGFKRGQRRYYDSPG